MRYSTKIKAAIKQFLVRTRNKPKIFVIGTWKTGTTSLNHYFKKAGYFNAPQKPFQLEFQNYQNGQFDKILDLIEKWETFQDTPFACSNEAFLNALQQRYPNAKFILNIRNTKEEWFESLERYYQKLLVGKEGGINWADLDNNEYLYRGFLGECNRYIVGDAEIPLDPILQKKFYTEHNNAIRTYFKGKKCFLEINLKDPNAPRQLAEFLRIKEIAIPHDNKSREYPLSLNIPS